MLFRSNGSISDEHEFSWLKVPYSDDLQVVTKSITLKTLQPLFSFSLFPLYPDSLFHSHISQLSPPIDLPCHRSRRFRSFSLPIATLQIVVRCASTRRSLAMLQLASDTSSFYSWRRFILCPIGDASSATLHRRRFDFLCTSDDSPPRRPGDPSLFLHHRPQQQFSKT